VEGHFPIKYLGLPLHFEKLKRDDLQPLIDNLLKRMAGWRGKLLSLEARRLLIQTVLASIPIYMISFFKFPKWALKLINTQLANCLWSDEDGNVRNRRVVFPGGQRPQHIVTCTGDNMQETP
jgi:hypothetical protein